MLWILSLPLITKGGAYEAPKIICFFAVGFFLTLFWLVKSKIKINKVLGLPDLFYLGWLLTLLISSIIGISPIDSIIGGSYRHQGIIFFFTLWLVSKTLLLLNDNEKKILKKGFLLVAIIEAILVIFTKNNLGTFGDINQAAGFMAIVLSFSLTSYPILTIPIAAVILATASRSAILVLALSFAILIFQKSKKITITLLILSLSYIFLILPIKLSSPFENRIVIWQMAVENIIKKPLLGYGAETNEIIYENSFKKINLPLSGLIIDRSHNIFLDILLWSGIPGLILFTAWLISTKKIIKILPWLVFAFFQPLGVVHWILLFILLIL